MLQNISRLRSLTTSSASSSRSVFLLQSGRAGISSTTAYQRNGFAPALRTSPSSVASARVWTSASSLAACRKVLEATRLQKAMFSSAPQAASQSQLTEEEKRNRIENANLLRFVEAYRAYGHLVASINPLVEPATSHPQLDLSLYGLEGAQSKSFPLAGIVSIPGKSSATLEEIQAHLRGVYAANVGVEFSHVTSVPEREWLAKHTEEYLSPSNGLSAEDKLEIQRLLQESELFDRFMQTKFRSVKRYALEGCEAMMPAMNTLFNVAVKSGISNVVIGMPHRGRLNLLTGLLKMSPTVVFAKSKGISEIPSDSYATGDVLSHLAISSQLDNGLQVSLLHNPSHLEAINPVTMGKARSKQTILGDTRREKVLAVQLHGDAAFIGQGITTETLELANLPGFTTGGSFHLIVNNQLGFTTDPRDGRSSRYSSDIGKSIETPVFHVNADAPEDVVKVIRLALAYRNTFKKDVIVDLIGYRRHGHNELDEPAFTQPQMYTNIRARKTVAETYTQKLISESVLSSETVAQNRAEIQAKFEKHFAEVDNFKAPATHLQGRWSKLTDPTDLTQPIESGVKLDLLEHIGRKSVDVGSTLIHSRLDKMFCQVRLEKLSTKKDIDWATAESLAFGSLLAEGHSIRISGQDVGRGTFSQRHLVFVDQRTQERVIPLNNLGLSQNQGKVEAVNSNLSELAVTAFEYGYSINDPYTLPIWEAQFGDFANGAQITIDQFIASSETKWLRQTGLVLLLPHGYDGAGPEHSSCKMERFLQLVDSDALNPNHEKNINLQVINPTTPANYFHALRRQQLRSYRKPLVVVGPKTLIRLPAAVSTLEEMGPNTTFKPVLSDNSPAVSDPSTVKTVAFVSGKIYYDLVRERDARKRNDIVFVRLEELAPFPYAALRSELSRYGAAESFLWVQEEGQNMGAWNYVQPRFAHVLPSNQQLRYIGRPPLAASAVGISKLHQAESAAIFAQTFATSS